MGHPGRCVMSWRDEPMLGFDLETDCPDPDDARIITACAGMTSPSGWKPTNWTLRTERPIPAEAQAIHGITTDYANEYGIDRAVGVAAVRAALQSAWAAGTPVVGFNIVYDLTVLDRELRRVGQPGLRVTGTVIDGLVLDKATDRYRKGSRKLVDVAAHYGIPLGTDAHGAEADALASCRLVWKLGAHPSLPGELRDLHAFQVEAYEDQRRSFAEYRRRKGEPLDDESTDWPLRPAALVAA